MSTLRKKFTIGMRRHLIAKSLVLIDSGIGMTRHKHSVLDSEASATMGCDVVPDSDSIVNRSVSLQDQMIASAWRTRRNESVDLAIRVGLFKSEKYMISISGSNVLVSRYVMTNRGRRFQALPISIQWSLIAAVVAFTRISKVATRFKWIAGVTSFVILAVRIWHSGAINAAWIAISLIAALVIASVASIWG